MKRYNSLNEAIEGGDKPKLVELISELIPGHSYTIDGNGPYVMGEIPTEDNPYIFKDAETGEPFDLTRSELEGLITDGKVTEYIVKKDETQNSVPEYPKLDRFTRNTFSARTSELWEQRNIRSQFSASDLLDLDDMVNKLQEMPLPNEAGYERLLKHSKWSLLKRYLKALVPDIELPEILA